MTLSLAELLRVMPGAERARAAVALPYLNLAMDESGIDTVARRAAFLAQLAHESGSLRYTREIADGTAYDGRRDLGNTHPQAIAAATLAYTTPGPYYKGRGYLQVTGYANYAACSQALFGDADTLTHNPDLLGRPDLAARSAGWYWRTHGLNALADAGEFAAITRRINGGLNGQADRLAHYRRAQEVLDAA